MIHLGIIYEGTCQVALKRYCQKSTSHKYLVICQDKNTGCSNKLTVSSLINRQEVRDMDETEICQAA